MECMLAAICRVVALTLACSGAYAWDRDDTVREAAYLALHAADWSQTRTIAESPEYFEYNEILGRNPTAHEVDEYFAATVVLHVAVAATLPEKWRKRFQWASIGVEAAAVSHNASIGIKLHF